MSMLARYRKTGGFEQLRALLESSLSKKREMLFKAIEGEDKEWAALLKASMLTFEKIGNWDPLLISEATSRMGDKALAVLMVGRPEEIFNRFTHTFRDMKKRDIKTIMENLKPTPVETESALIKLFEKVRELEKEGSLRLDKDGNPQAGPKAA